MNTIKQAGIIKQSNSTFTDSIVLVKKKDGSIRLYLDYRIIRRFIYNTHSILLLNDFNSITVLFFFVSRYTNDLLQSQMGHWVLRHNDYYVHN